MRRNSRTAGNNHHFRRLALPPTSSRLLPFSSSCNGTTAPPPAASRVHSQQQPDFRQPFFYSVFCHRRPPRVVNQPPFLLPVSIPSSILFLSMCRVARNRVGMFLSFPWLYRILYAFSGGLNHLRRPPLPPATVAMVAVGSGSVNSPPLIYVCVAVA